MKVRARVLGFGLIPLLAAGAFSGAQKTTLIVALSNPPKDPRGDLLQHHVETIRVGAEEGAEAILFGERSLVAELDLEALSEPDMNSLAEERLKAVSAACRKWNAAAIVGTVHSEAGKVYNQAVVVDRDGRLLQRYSQSHPPQGSPFSGALDLPLFDLCGVEATLAIGNDLRNPELARIPVLGGARILYHLEHSERPEDADKQIQILLRARALENGIFVAQAGCSPTMLIDPEGNPLDGHPLESPTASVNLVRLDLSRVNRDGVERGAELPLLRPFWNEGQRALRQANRSHFPPKQPVENSIRIATISFIPKKWDKDFNFATSETLIRKAASKGGVDLVVTPEGILEGYVVNEVIAATGEERVLLEKRFLEIGEPIDGPYVERFKALARELGVMLCVGFQESRQDGAYNTAALIGRDGALLGQYDKTHLAEGYGNPSCSMTGNRFPSFPTDKARIGMVICYDRQLPEPARYVRLSGADLILAPSYGSTGEWNDQVIRMRARENGVPMVFCHPKQALFVDAAGEVLANIYATDHIEICDVPLPTKVTDRITLRRPDLYSNLPFGQPSLVPKE